MNIFISVISHGHANIIKELNVLPKLADSFCVVVKSNRPEEISTYCTSNSIVHLNGDYGLGFGENNNHVYRHCRDELGMTDEDMFVVLNPDVLIKEDDIRNLVISMDFESRCVAGINLFKDRDFSISDNSVRRFPTFRNFLRSFLGLGNDTIIDKSKITSPTPVDWIAGSFLAFRSKHYNRLGGFDEQYFMYCEDVDICYRSYMLGFPVYYYPDIVALHLAQHANRQIFSRHFVWHVESALRFLLKKRTFKSATSLF